MISLVFYTFLHKKRKKIKVVDIICYPIKSCAGIHLAKAEIYDFGIKDDSKWGIIEENKVVSQISEPRLIKLQPSFKYDIKGARIGLILSYPGFPDFFLNISDGDSNIQSFSIEKSEEEYADEGPNASKWLKSIFDKDFKLGRFVRVLGKIKEFPNKDLDTRMPSFDSEEQLLLVNQSSFKDLGSNLPSYLKEKVGLGWFRPNIVIKNAEPSDEDTWKIFKINNVTLKSIKKNDVSRITCIEPGASEFNSDCELLKTLKKVHGDGTKGYFGIFINKLSPLSPPGFIQTVHASNGMIRLKDEVHLLSRTIRE